MKSRQWKICLGAALLAGLGFVVRPLHAYWLLHSAEIESNRLYGEYRPFLYRWVGAPYEKSISLDPGTCNPVSESEINRLLLQTAKAEKILGPTSRSLRLQGRAGLLSCQPEQSIEKYKRAILAKPEDADLQLELGMAFALNANSTNPLEYEGALEHMLRADQKRKTPESLYDSALLFQQVQLPIQARERWSETTAAESIPEWKKESNQQLEASQNFLSARERRVTALSSPISYLVAGESEQKEGEELALDIATREWVDEIWQSPDAKRAVQHLGSLLLRDHHDDWLLDLLKINSLPEAQNALSRLAEAARLNLKGEHGHAADAARSAEEIFERLHNPAGALRARLEIVYSLDRRDNPDDCLAKLGVKLGDPEAKAQPGSMEVEANKREYTWIKAQTRLEHITCLTRKRRQDVIGLRRDAYDWINSTGYRGLALRSLGFMTEPYVAADSRSVLWRRAQRGMKIFWSNPLPVIRVYAFYYTLAASARESGDLQTALAILREGTLLLKNSGLNLIRGILLSSLGQWEMERGLQEDADRTFAEMTDEFKELETSEITPVWDEAEVAHAEALVAAGRTQDGLALLLQRTKDKSWPYSSLKSNLRRVLLPAFGNAYLRTGDLQDACRYFLQSITETQDKVATVQSHAQRDNALREVESSWRGMTAVMLNLQRPVEALAVWETFRSGRNVTKRSFAFPDCGSASSPSSFSPPENQTALVYAFLPTGLSGWLIGQGTVEQKQFDGTSIKSRAKRLSALVSDPNSRIEDISILGTELYQMLLAPFANSLPPSGSLIIDADGELAGIPWNVLEQKKGHPLLERFSITQVIGILDLGMTVEQTQAGLDRALIFGPPNLHGDLAYKYPYLPDAADEAATVHHLLPNSLFFRNEDVNLETLKTYASRTSLFHFPGHTISNAGSSALLLPNVPGGPPETQYVTAEQIAALDLRQMKTVVLASCSSGTGEKYGTVNLDSLARAFLEAGTQRVIAAGWDVNSVRAEELMIAFYKRLKEGEFPAEALRQAQLRIRQKWPHPHYWAGFQVFGEP